MKRWNDLKANDLPALNRALEDAKQPAIHPEADPQRQEPQLDEE